MIEGLIGRYMLRPSSPNIAKQYVKVMNHIHRKEISSDDLGQIRRALLFFLPMFNGEPDVQSSIRSAIVQTDVLIRKEAFL